MQEIRKYDYPVTKVYYKHVHIGDIENEHEFLLFREDMIGNPEHNLYHLETPKGTSVTIDEFGCCEYTEELEEMNDILANIIDKQMARRLDKLDK